MVQFQKAILTAYSSGDGLTRVFNRDFHKKKKDYKSVLILK